MQERIGTFLLLKQIGRGAMGVVHLAQEESLNRRVALKLLSPELSCDPKFVERFKREAQSAATLKHPNIVQIYSFFQDKERFCFAMEYVKGQTLRDFMESNGPLPWAEALRLTLQIAKALEHAHARGVVHRDVKPGNILLEEETARIVVTDFGLSRVLTDSRLTRDGEVLGTPEYMSPEQIEGKELDGRTDLYSLGIVLFELLTGRLPFVAEKPVALLRMHMDQEAPQAHLLEKKVPRDAGMLCHKLLAKAPENRFDNASDLCVELNRLLLSESETDLNLPGKFRRGTQDSTTPRRRWVWVPIAGALLLTGMATGIWLTRETPPDSMEKTEEGFLDFDRAFQSASEFQRQGDYLAAMEKFWAISALTEDASEHELAKSAAGECLVLLVTTSDIPILHILRESDILTASELAPILRKTKSGKLHEAATQALETLMKKGLLTEGDVEQLTLEAPKKTQRQKEMTLP